MYCRLVIVLAAMGLTAPAQEWPIPRPNPMIPAGAWSTSLKEHPRLLGSRAYLKERAQARPQDWQQISKSQELAMLGVAHAVEGRTRQQVDPHIREAIKNVGRGVTNIHQDTWIWLAQVAMVYDQFHDLLTPQERQQMIDWINPHLEKFTADENAFHNSTLSKVLCYLRIAYGTWGENPRAKEFRDHALLKLYEGKLLPVIKEFGQGGGFTECGWYTRGSLWNLVEALELARRFEGYDGFTKAPLFFYQRLAYEMLQPYPGRWVYGTERFACEGDGSTVYGGHTEYPRHTRMLLAQYYRGSELARCVANTRRRGSNPQAAFVDFLYEESPEPAPLPLETYPLAHHAAGIGKVYARSDWTDAATWFRFECGDLWNGHQHYETGNFEIFRYEPLATESGEYADYVSNHSVNWLIRTVAHNCILINQPDQEWNRQRDGGRNAYANDGGQDRHAEWFADNLPQWLKQRDQWERGRIVAYENQPKFMYVAGDCTKAYDAFKLKSWIRQIVFLRPGTFVIYDRVVSTNSVFQKTWLLHSRFEPKLDGNTASIENGKGKLIVRTLLPESAKIEKIEGYTYGGRTFNEVKNAQSETANRWRIEVKPAEPETEDVFLHVLFTDQPQETKLRREGKAVWLDVGPNSVIFTRELGGSVRLSGERISLKPKVVWGKYE